MANTAAHLVDRVLPNVPVRQWVLSLPFDLRTVAAKRPDLVSAIDRILFSEVQRFMRDAASQRTGRAGAVTFVQRFGGSLNLHVHFHVLFLEGVFTREDDALPVFHPALSPTRSDLLAVLTRVRNRVSRWLARHGIDGAPPVEPVEGTGPDALDACAIVAVQPGLFDKLAGEQPLRAGDSDHDEPAGLGRNSVSLDGFNLHAAVTVGADDDRARERLVRYCARPPFALERLSLLPDGRIAYRIKIARKNATHRILEPIELLARIAALIPPPRHPFMRYHGVLAPSSKWRRAIVPRAEPRERSTSTAVTPSSGPAAAAARDVAVGTAPPSRVPHWTTPPIATSPSGAGAAPAPPPATPFADYARITAAHRARLEGGELLANGPRLDWAKLLRRTFACDVLVCPRCTGRARVLTAIHDPSEARRFLDALDQRSIPRAAPTRRSHDDGGSQLASDENGSQLAPDDDESQLAVDEDASAEAHGWADAYVDDDLDDLTPFTPAYGRTAGTRDEAPPSSRPEAPPPDD
jgi:hypothetical protein